MLNIGQDIVLGKVILLYNYCNQFYCPFMNMCNNGLLPLHW